MSILTLGGKKKERKFPIKERKKEGRKFPIKERKKEERKFPIKEKEKKRKGNSQLKSGRKQKKERKFPIKDRKKTEEIYRKVFLTRQYLNNTELSPNEQKEGRETTT